MKLKPLHLIAAAALTVGAIFAYPAVADRATELLEPGISVSMSLVDSTSGDVITTWVVGYEEARFNPFSAVRPLSYEARQTNVQDSAGNKYPFLSGTISGKVVGREMKTDLKTNAFFIVTKPLGGQVRVDNPAADAKTVPPTGGKVEYNFVNFYGSNRQLMCGNADGANIQMWAWLQATGTDNFGEVRHGEDSAQFTVKTSCAGTLSVALTAYPFTAVRETTDGPRVVTMQPTAIGGLV